MYVPLVVVLGPAAWYSGQRTARRTTGVCVRACVRVCVCVCVLVLGLLMTSFLRESIQENIKVHRRLSHICDYIFRALLQRTGRPNWVFDIIVRMLVVDGVTSCHASWHLCW